MRLFVFPTDRSGKPLTSYVASKSQFFDFWYGGLLDLEISDFVLRIRALIVGEIQKCSNSRLTFSSKLFSSINTGLIQCFEESIEKFLPSEE